MVIQYSIYGLCPDGGSGGNDDDIDVDVILTKATGPDI